MRALLAAASLLAIGVLGLGAAGQAQIWGPTTWTDDFEDGNYSSSPAWSVFGDPFMAASRAVVPWEGDYAFRLTAPYVDLLGAGWSGAYVVPAEEEDPDQGLLCWVDTSALPGDGAAICLLRYTPNLANTGFGTGYAVAILRSGDAVAAQLFQINDSDYTEITDPAVVSATYTDVWVRFVAILTNPNTILAARLWPAGESEPTGWTLDSNVHGSASGITVHYDSGHGGVGTVATASGVTAITYFDDIQFAEDVLCAEPPW